MNRDEKYPLTDQVRRGLFRCWSVAQADYESLTTGDMEPEMRADVEAALAWLEQHSDGPGDE